MITRRYEVDNLVGAEIRLGRVGENAALCVEFDVRQWLAHYPDAFVVLFVIPPAPPTPYRPGMPGAKPPSQSGYPAATTFEDGIVSWVVTSTDLMHDGQGAVELILYGKTGEIVQSTVVKTKVSKSLSHNNHCGCGPSPMQPWVDQVAQLRMETMEAAERAEAAADAAQQVAIKNSIPTGGKTNQVLAKLSDNDRDVGWVDMASSEKQVVNMETHYDFPSVGSTEVIYKAQSEKKLYQWNPEALKYERLDEEEPEVTQVFDVIHGGDANGTD